MIDFLMIELMALKKQQGYQQVNLGLAPPSEHRDDALMSLLDQVGAFMYQPTQMMVVEDNAVRRQWFEMYKPVWVPKYLVSRGGSKTSRILRDLAKLSFPKTTELRSDTDEA